MKDDVPDANANVATSWWTLRFSSGNGKRPYSTVSACLPAKMSSFYELTLRAKIGHEAWQFLRQFEPELLPWSPDESMMAVNKQILTSGHPLLGCIPDYDHCDFFDPQRHLKLGTGSGLSIWCEKHQRLERWLLPETLWWQLACGNLEFEEFITVVTRQNPKNAASLHGSHLCGNGTFCIGLNCIIYELPKVNYDRIQCHKRVERTSGSTNLLAFGSDKQLTLSSKAPTPACICTEGGRTDRECYLDRRRISPTKLHKLFLAKLNDPKNRLAYVTCPIEGCEMECASKTMLSQLKAGTPLTVGRAKNQVGVLTDHKVYKALDRLVSEHLQNYHSYKSMASSSSRTSPLSPSHRSIKRH